MKKLLKYVGYIVLSGLAVVSLYLVNLFLMKPYSIDHYLAKELTVSLLDSPEFMTYIGIFDPFNAILKHNQKLSIDSLEDDEKDHQDTIKQLEMLTHTSSPPRRYSRSAGSRTRSSRTCATHWRAPRPG